MPEVDELRAELAALRREVADLRKEVAALRPNVNIAAPAYPEPLWPVIAPLPILPTVPPPWVPFIPTTCDPLPPPVVATCEDRGSSVRWTDGVPPILTFVGAPGKPREEGLGLVSFAGPPDQV